VTSDSGFNTHKYPMLSNNITGPTAEHTERVKLNQPNTPPKPAQQTDNKRVNSPKINLKIPRPGTGLPTPALNYHQAYCPFAYRGWYHRQPRPKVLFLRHGTYQHPRRQGSQAKSSQLYLGLYRHQPKPREQHNTRSVVNGVRATPRSSS